MALGSQQYPRQQYTTGPASDRPLLAGKPVQGATSATPDSRYASVAPSKPVADIVKEYASFVKPIQTSDQPRSIESISNPVQSQASSTPSMNAFSAFTNQYGGAENIGGIPGLNKSTVPTNTGIQDNSIQANPEQFQQISNDYNVKQNEAVGSLLDDIKFNGITEQEIPQLYPEFANLDKDVIGALYDDIKFNGIQENEVQNLYPELYTGIKSDKQIADMDNYGFKQASQELGQDIQSGVDTIKSGLNTISQKADNIPMFNGLLDLSTLAIKGGVNVGNQIIQGLVRATGGLGTISEGKTKEGIVDIAQGGTQTTAGIYAPIISGLFQAVGEDPTLKPVADFVMDKTNMLGEVINKVPGLKQFRETLSPEYQAEFDNFVGGSVIALIMGSKSQSGKGVFQKGYYQDMVSNPGAFARQAIDPTAIMRNFQESILNIPSKFVPKNTGPKPKVGPDNAKAKQVAGEIIQGKEKQQVAAATTLTDIDMKGVKTYKEASAKVGEHQKNIIKAEDNYLSKDVVSYTKADTVIETKVGEVTIKQDFISDGIADLKDIYKGDAVKLEELNQIEAKYNNEGLTLKEQNDFARRYNTDTPKGFNVMGDPLTGVTKVRQEKTRTGIKTTIKKNLPDGGEYLTKLDKKYSDSVTTKRLLDKMDERVNKMKQKGADTSRLEKLVTKLWDTYQLFTTPIRYAIGASRPKKSLTALDLEAKLPKFLKKLDQIVTESGKTNNNLGREAYQKQVELMTRTIEREIEMQRKYNSETTKTEDFEKSTLGEKPALGEGKSESIVAGSSLESDKNAGVGNQSLGLPMKQQNQTPSQLEQGNQKTNIEEGLSEAGQKQKPNISVDQSLSRGDSSRDKTLGNDVVNTASRSDNSKNTSSIIDNTKPVSTPKPKTILDTIVAKKIEERKAKEESIANSKAQQKGMPKQNTTPVKEDTTDYKQSLKGGILKVKPNNQVKYNQGDSYEPVRMVLTDVDAKVSRYGALVNRDMQSMMGKGKPLSAGEKLEIKRIEKELERTPSDILERSKFLKEEAKRVRKSNEEVVHEVTTPREESQPKDIVTKAVEKAKAKVVEPVKEVASKETDITSPKESGIVKEKTMSIKETTTDKTYFKQWEAMDDKQYSKQLKDLQAKGLPLNGKNGSSVNALLYEISRREGKPMMYTLDNSSIYGTRLYPINKITEAKNGLYIVDGDSFTQYKIPEMDERYGKYQDYWMNKTKETAPASNDKLIGRTYIDNRLSEKEIIGYDTEKNMYMVQNKGGDKTRYSYETQADIDNHISKTDDRSKQIKTEEKAIEENKIISNATKELYNNDYGFTEGMQSLEKGKTLKVLNSPSKRDVSKTKKAFIEDAVERNAVIKKEESSKWESDKKVMTYGVYEKGSNSIYKSITETEYDYAKYLEERKSNPASNDLLQEAKKYKTAEEFTKSEPTITVNIEDLKPTDGHTYESTIGVNGGPRKEFANKPPYVSITKEGKYQIHDGNHRYFLAKNKGDTKIKVKLMNYFPVTKAENYHIDQLRDIRQQANKESQTPTKPQGEKPKNDVLSRAIDKVKSKKVDTIKSEIKNKLDEWKNGSEKKEYMLLADKRDALIKESNNLKGEELKAKTNEINAISDKMASLMNKSIAKSEKGTIIDSNSSIKTKDMQDLYTEARKYKSAEEFLDGLRKKYSNKVEELTKKQKLENPDDPVGYNKAKEDFYNKNGITKSDLEVVDNNKYANIKGMEDDYTQYKKRGQDDFAEQQKKRIDEAKKSNAIFDRYDKVSEQRSDYYKANEKDIMLSANKWMSKDDADFVMMIKHDLPPVPKLKQIWEEANKK